jgi:hypothetical protein
MQIGMKGFQNSFVTMAWGKKPSEEKRKKETHLYPSSLKN